MILARVGSLARVTTVATAAIALLRGPGCGGDPSKPKLAKVSGTVTYKGKPVTKGLVSFVPATGPGTQTGQSATGELNSSGQFTLTTFDNGDGAVIGEHIVMVQSREEDPAIEGGGMPIPDAKGNLNIKPAKDLVPTKYATADNSPLRMTVEDRSNDFMIVLED
jgi:hypothetical protein